MKNIGISAFAALATVKRITLAIIMLTMQTDTIEAAEAIRNADEQYRIVSRCNRRCICVEVRKANNMIGSIDFVEDK